MNTASLVEFNRLAPPLSRLQKPTVTCSPA